MKKTKSILVMSFASFSMFFGAGNLILPPFLGFQAGANWLWVALGFALSAVVVPLLGILAHAKLQGTILDFTKKIPSVLGVAYCFAIYAVCLLLPAPRTASLTYELAVSPFVAISPLWFSSLYFFFVFVVVLNRSKIIDILGSYLTPVIIGAIILIVAIFLLSSPFSLSSVALEAPFFTGILEGYQTFDAIAGIVVGGVVVTSLNVDKTLNYKEKQDIVVRSGLLTGVALFTIYAGFIYVGALLAEAQPSASYSRVGLLSAIAKEALGREGALVVSILVSVACFSTAVGIVAGAADFVKSRTKNSIVAYRLTVLIACVFGVLVGRFDVFYIIAIAVPVLVLIYPVTIMFVVLNVFPERMTTKTIFVSVISSTFLFSLLDFFVAIKWIDAESFTILPLGKYQLGWLLPAIGTWIGAWLCEKGIRSKKELYSKVENI